MKAKADEKPESEAVPQEPQEPPKTDLPGESQPDPDTNANPDSGIPGKDSISAGSNVVEITDLLDGQNNAPGIPSGSPFVASNDLPPLPVGQAQASDDQPEQGEQSGPLTCPICGKQKQYRSQMIRHYKGGHPERADELEKALPAFRTGRFGGVPNKPKAPAFDDIKQAMEQSAVQGLNKVVDYETMAGTVFDMTTGLMSTVVGPEWQAKSLEERGMIVQPLAAYMKSKNMDDLPPGVVLSFVCVAYASQRVNQPNTKDKLARGWLWLKSKLKRKPKP